MNTSIYTSPQNNPELGDTYYNITDNKFCIYDGDSWNTITDISNSMIAEKFIWQFELSKPYLKIMDKEWLNNNYQEVVNWLNETKSGDLLPDLSAIIFNSKEHAILFKLKYN